MLHNQALDSQFRRNAEDEDSALLDAFSCNVQDRHWLVYCALGGHEHYDLPDIDPRSGLCLPELFAQAA